MRFAMLLPCLLGACVSDSAPHDASGALAWTSEGTAFLANADDGELVLLERTGAPLVRFDVGERPSAVAVLDDDTALVSLRGEGRVVHVGRSEGRWVELDSVDVGPEPFGIVVDGRRAWVAVSQADRISELALDPLEVVATLPVGGAPRWLARSDGQLFVAGPSSRAPTRIDLASGEVVEVPLPAQEASGRPLEVRFTGVPAVLDGGEVVFPVLLVDRTVPVLISAPAYYVSYSEPRVHPAAVRASADSAEVIELDDCDDFNTATPTALAASGSTLLMAMPGASSVRRFSQWGTGRCEVVRGTGRTRELLVSGDRMLAYDELEGLARHGAIEGRAGLSAPTPVSGHTLPADVRAGRVLFEATDNRMITGGAGTTCGSCHFEGWSDGITWSLINGRLQTPSLAGRVSETVPLTWAADVASIEDEARNTSELRLGGSPSDEALADLAAFVDWTPLPLRAEGDVDAVARGEALFERADVGCAECHRGARYDDGQRWFIAGLGVANTPSLSGVGATAPYFHDGSAATLRDVLEFARDGAMGDTSGLSEGELDDLQAFLQSL